MHSRKHQLRFAKRDSYRHTSSSRCSGNIDNLNSFSMASSVENAPDNLILIYFSFSVPKRAETTSYIRPIIAKMDQPTNLACSVLQK